LAGLALPNCKSYHRWHNKMVKGRFRNEGQEKKRKEMAEKIKTTLHDVILASGTMTDGQKNKNSADGQSAALVIFGFSALAY